MILKVHVPGAEPYAVGDEIWHTSLEDALAAEAQLIADHAGAELLESPEPEHREQLRRQVIAEMTSALSRVGDSYRAPDGVRYSLLEEPVDEQDTATIDPVPAEHSPTVQQVVRFEELPLGSLGSRRAIVRWSDGTQSEALTWYADEIHISERDLLGKTAEQLRNLHFRRDRDWLQS